MTRFSWTQPCCNSCWEQMSPGREPVRMRSEHTDPEECCLCGYETFAGIYIRVDPTGVFNPTKLKD